MRVPDHLGGDALGDAIEPRRRIDHATLDVVVGDELLVVAVGLLRAAAHELDQPVGVDPEIDRHVAELALAEVIQLVVGARDAPLGGAVDVVLGLRLGGVEGLQRVGVVVAEHAGAIGRRRPVLQCQALDQVVIPAAHLLGRPAPEAVAGVQHMVLEILELVVGRLGPFQVELGMGEEHALPQVGVHAREVTQRVERQLVMRAPGVGGIDDAEEQVHGRPDPAEGEHKSSRI